MSKYKFPYSRVFGRRGGKALEKNRPKYLVPNHYGFASRWYKDLANRVLTLFHLFDRRNRKDRATKPSESRCAPLPSSSPSLHLSLILRAILSDRYFLFYIILSCSGNCSSYRIAFARCSVSDPNVLSDLWSDWTDATFFESRLAYICFDKMWGFIY